MGLRIFSAGRLRGGAAAIDVVDQSPCDGCPFTSVLTYGADPTGTVDSTAAFQAAVTGSPISSTILVPFTDDGGTYLVDADAVTWHSRRWVGDLLDDIQRTRIVARTAGTALIQTGSAVAFENIDIDGADLVDYSVQLNPGHATLLKNCIVRGGADYGLHVDDGAITLELVTFTGNDKGLYLLGPNGSTFSNVNVLNNTNRGVTHLGLGSALTTQSGAMAWYGGVIQGNGGTEQMLVDGVQGSVYSGLVIDGAADGIRFDNDAHNLLISGATFVGPETHFAARVDDAFMLTFAGCNATGTDYSRIRMDPSNAGDVTVPGSFRSDAAGSIEELKPFWPGATPFTADPRASGGYVASAAPTLGIWRAGTVIWNSAAGPPSGWRCTVSGSPGTWVSF